MTAIWIFRILFVYFFCSNNISRGRRGDFFFVGLSDSRGRCGQLYRYRTDPLIQFQPISHPRRRKDRLRRRECHLAALPGWLDLRCFIIIDLQKRRHRPVDGFQDPILLAVTHELLYRIISRCDVHHIHRLDKPQFSQAGRRIRRRHLYSQILSAAPHAEIIIPKFQKISDLGGKIKAH